MEAFITQGSLYKCFESLLAWLGSDLGDALVKWDPHLFIGTNGTL